MTAGNVRRLTRDEARRIAVRAQLPDGQRPHDLGEPAHLEELDALARWLGLDNAPVRVTDRRRWEGRQMERAGQAGVTGTSILRLLAVYCLVLTVVVGLLHSYKPLAAIGSVVGVAVLVVVILILWRMEPRGVGAGPGMPGALPRARAVRVGLICGLLWILEISVNNLLAPPLPGRDWFDDVIWAVISLVILVSATRASYGSGRLGTGVVFGAWAGLASGLAACATALSLVVFGMSFLTADPLAQQEWAVRGAASMAPTITEYVAFETFAGAFAHLLVVGVAMSTLLGVVGGAIGVVLAWTRRRFASRRAGPSTR